MLELTAYLAGEIHSDWRQQIAEGVSSANLPVTLLSPVDDHASSDDCGVTILGQEEKPFWKDHKGARINQIRTRIAIERSDIVVVRFGDKYRQWNAAFDAGAAVALGKSLITLHPPELTHPLKEVNAAALASCETCEQVVSVLRYVLRGEL
jgi:YtoQ family protein